LHAINPALIISYADLSISSSIDTYLLETCFSYLHTHQLCLQGQHQLKVSTALACLKKKFIENLLGLVTHWLDILLSKHFPNELGLSQQFCHL
jgi:hypothetical protein